MKLKKSKLNFNKYLELVNYCDENNLIVVDKGDYYESEDPDGDIDELRNRLLTQLKSNVENYIYNNYPLHRQNNIAIYGTDEERQRFKIFKEYNTNIYHKKVDEINKAKNLKELKKINIENIFSQVENVENENIVNEEEEEKNA